MPLPERWSGKAGLSQWKIKYALIDAAREYGKMIPNGVWVSLSWRDLAERAGVAPSTVEGNIPKMKKAGEIRTDNLNRHLDEAGAFVLLFPESANSVHSLTITELLRTTELTSVPDLRVLKKLRHAAPGVWRLGPRAGMATLALLRSGGTLSYEQLASKLGISRARSSPPRARARAHGVCWNGCVL
jgi:transcriptional regulator with XRE-family HTH domain